MEPLPPISDSPPSGESAKEPMVVPDTANTDEGDERVDVPRDPDCESEVSSPTLLGKSTHEDATNTHHALGRMNRLRAMGRPSGGDAWQRWVMLSLSMAVTALGIGAVLGGWWFAAKYDKQLSDPEFLQTRLDELSGDTQEQTLATPPALVRVASLALDTIQPTRPVFGRLVEYRKVTVSTEVEGKIVEMPVEEGTPVVANETLLVRVDDVWLRLEIQQVEAELRSVDAQLTHEQNELERWRRLSQTASVTASDLENQQSLVQQLTATRAKTEAMLEEKRERLKRATITAPFDGTVVRKLAEVGQTLSNGDALVEIVSRGTIDAEIRVPETLIDRLHVDSQLQVTIDALDAQQAGRVVSIVPYGPTASRTFPVRVRLDDQKGRLKVGMSVHADVPAGVSAKELVIDRNGVLERPDGSTVWLVVPAADTAGAGASDAAADPSALQAVPVPVRIVARNGALRAVRAEATQDSRLLKPGAQVVIEGAERLTAGQPVRVVKLDPEFLKNLPQASGHEVDATN